MAVQNSNFNTLITAIDTKAQSLAASTTDPKDLVYLAKSLEALNVTATVSDVIAAGDTKVTAVNTAGTTQVAAVQAEGSTQVAAVAAAGSGYATSGNVDALRNIILVTVAGGKLVMDGTSQQALKLTPSVKYRFDQSDSSNATHPLQFSITDDGTHGSGAALTAGITVVGTAGSANSYVEITLEQDAVATYYYCANHAAMGGTAYTTTVSGGGASTYTGAFELDTFSDNLTAAGASLAVANLNAYARGVRIRGLDTSTKAIFGINHQSQNTAGNEGRHTFTCLSANQTTGAIVRESVMTFDINTGSYADYSTFSQASDEWTGRYTYRGNVPTNNQAHQYSYHRVLIKTDTQGVSEHVVSGNFYPVGNDNTTGSYVAPAERRHGGAVKHFLQGYNTSSQANVLLYDYQYSTTLANNSIMNFLDIADLTKPLVTTNHQVDIFNQWDVTTEPFYAAFHSFKEGLYARVRTNGNWNNLGATRLLGSNHAAFMLSNGSIMLKAHDNSCHHITSSGVMTEIPTSSQLNTGSVVIKNFSKFCLNIGTDEWLQFLPGSKVVKFTINPANGYATLSNSKIMGAMEYRAFDNNFHERTGLWSKMSPGTTNTAATLFTFGNENASGPGYGKSKAMFIGSSNGSKTINAATYDIASVAAELTYP